jgi:hypothetical protein
MIKCIFTIDYEIYGNGEGSLEELVYEPAARLRAIFRRHGACLVPFIEVAELEMIEAQGSDPALPKVTQQIRDFRADGFELGLHLHPQWYNGQYTDGVWTLDYREYNLCTLPRERILEIVSRGINYLRSVLGEPDFTPLSFRAGNWLFQPTRPAVEALSAHGIRIDSSVFRGGLQRQHGLDYRKAPGNIGYWRFRDHVHVPDRSGHMLELPIYTEMVPFWKMLTNKRIELGRARGSQPGNGSRRLGRYLDLLRLRYPLKFDFCRMTLSELTRMMDRLIRIDRESPNVFRPIVAIGHTKDLHDFDAIEAFLFYLVVHGIPTATFSDVYPHCIAGDGANRP